MIAGAANNQLREPSDAERLAAKGIVWAPDLVANAGGVLHGAGLELLGWTPDQLAMRIERIGDDMAEILRLADQRGTTPLDVAEEVAAARLSGKGA